MTTFSQRRCVSWDKAKPLYEKALKNSGFNKNLKFKSIQTIPSQNRQRKSNNNAEVKTNIGKVFLKLV